MRVTFGILAILLLGCRVETEIVSSSSIATMYHVQGSEEFPFVDGVDGGKVSALLIIEATHLPTGKATVKEIELVRDQGRNWDEEPVTLVLPVKFGPDGEIERQVGVSVSISFSGDTKGSEPYRDTLSLLVPFFEELGGETSEFIYQTEWKDG